MLPAYLLAVLGELREGLLLSNNVEEFYFKYER